MSAADGDAVVAERAARWARARRLLVVRLDNLGDVMMATPAIRALKDAVAGRSVTLLASPAGAAAAPYIPALDGAIQYTAPWLPGGAGARGFANEATLATLRAGGFEAAVIFTTFSQSALPAALLCTLAGIPLRLAYSRENPYGLLSDWVPDPEPHTLVRHEVRRQLELVAAVGATSREERLTFAVPDEARMRAMAKLRAAGVDVGTPWIVVHPGASAGSRRYAPGRFAAALQALAEPAARQYVVTGSAAEAAAVTAVAQETGPGAVALAGALTLAELAAVIEGAALLIANNTGPVHLAAALGTPVVDLYALTNPQHAPWRVRGTVLYHDVPCRFCYRGECPQLHHDCLQRVDPRHVADAARALLDERADRWVPGVATVAQAAARPSAPAG